MISNLVLNKSLRNELPAFIGNQIFITKDNKRKTVRAWADIKALMRECSFAIRKEDKGETTAVLFVWKSNALNVTRNYVKIAYRDLIDVDDCLMVLNWNFNKEVYIKLDKNSPLINSFRQKGFKRCHDRGDEVLLCRSANDKRFWVPYKEGDLDEEE
jgi:hypothetical protein